MAWQYRRHQLPASSASLVLYSIIRQVPLHILAVFAWQLSTLAEGLAIRLESNCLSCKSVTDLQEPDQGDILHKRIVV